MLASRKSSSMRSARWSGCWLTGMLFQRPSNASTSACKAAKPFFLSHYQVQQDGRMYTTLTFGHGQGLPEATAEYVRKSAVH